MSAVAATRTGDLIDALDALAARLLEVARDTPTVKPNGELPVAMAQLVEAQTKLRQERPPKRRKARR